MVSFSFRFVDKKNSLSSFQVLAQKVTQYPRSGAGNTKYLGINKQMKRTVSSTVGATSTYNPCACYNDPGMGLTSFWVSTFNSCCVQQNGGPCNYIGPCK